MPARSTEALHFFGWIEPPGVVQALRPWKEQEATSNKGSRAVLLVTRAWLLVTRSLLVTSASYTRKLQLIMGERSEFTGRVEEASCCSDGAVNGFSWPTRTGSLHRVGQGMASRMNNSEDQLVNSSFFCGWALQPSCQSERSTVSNRLLLHCQRQPLANHPDTSSR